jgi:predicted regulator of Ras-like GTPase activity (Roadblock/LC7/MglB family)
VSDEIGRWSEELAGDPSSMVFIPLGEALRVRGQIDLAVRVATKGLERHPYDADAHDLMARIHVDRGEQEKAVDEWSAALRCAAGHVGALKGMGFVAFRRGELADAERYLAQAAAGDGDDEGIAAGLAHVRAQLAALRAPTPEEEREEGRKGKSREKGEERENGEDEARSGFSAYLAGDDGEEPGPGATNGSGSGKGPVAHGAGASGVGWVTPDVDPRYLFADLVAAGDQAALFLDADGLVLAGTYVVAGGVDVSQEIGAGLTGISDEARRAMRHLDLGDWSSIVFESEAARVAMAPAPDDGIVLVAASPATPPGLVRRALDRVATRARRWAERLA